MDSSLKIFIVEDDLFYQTMLFGVLKLRNFKHVKKMATGKECLENLYLKPDVIILDYSLSDMNGVELFKQIKKVSVKLPLQKQDALIIHDNNQAIKHGVINETKPKSNM